MATPTLPAQTLANHQARLDQEAFFRLCQVHREERLERKANGEIIMMSPAGGSAGYRNNELLFQLTLWAKKDGRGQVFDSSTG
jgi:Uma2 family endonuclease